MIVNLGVQQVLLRQNALADELRLPRNKTLANSING